MKSHLPKFVWVHSPVVGLRAAFTFRGTHHSAAPLTCTLLLGFILAQAQPVQNRSNLRTDESLRELEGTITRLMKEGEVPGLSLVLIRDGRVYWYRSFGVNNADSKARMNNSTVFETASLTKPVLAYGALKLVDSGKLNLDTPLAKYLPLSALNNDPRANLITARMVLSHRTGLQNELHPGEQLKIHFVPGERFSYSGEGFIYLQKVIERITAKRLDAYMQEAVFKPLQMRTASYLWRNSYESLMANGHTVGGIAAERIKPTEVNISWLHMNALDYSKFVIAVMNGVGLSDTSAKLMMTPQVQINESCIFCLTPPTGQTSPSISWGLGWGLESGDRGVAFWHWGENRGEFQTFAMAYPGQKAGVVIFTNSGNGFSIIPEIVSKAIGGNHPAFKWMGYEPYDSPKQIATRTQAREFYGAIRPLFREILAHGKAAITRYRNKKHTLNRTALNEAQVNSLGYWLKQKKRISEAIEVFRMNTQDYPNSWNAYDSLAEAYMDHGDNMMAIKYYRKSLELNAGNSSAVEAIKRLQRKQEHQ